MNDMIKVTVAILEKDGPIVLAPRKICDHLPGKWEFPGGKNEPGETPEECLARELKEEFDIDVAIGEHLGSNTRHYDHISIELMAYRASWVAGAITMNDHKGIVGSRLTNLPSLILLQLTFRLLTCYAPDPFKSNSGGNHELLVG